MMPAAAIENFPSLREDLRLFPASPHADGSPAWVIEDPVRNRHFRIGWLEFEFLSRWRMAPGDLLADIGCRTTLHPDEEQLRAFADFLRANDLLRPAPSQSQAMAQAEPRRPWSQAKWWLHNYLFFRIPLIHPTYWLRHLYRALRFLFHPATLWVVAALSLTGIVLTLRQWDTFQHTLFESVSWQGAMGFALALLVAKTLHEFGHALVATHFGVRVGHMGVAFLVMWPMLYTDTSESWRLAAPRKRLMIAAAGISTELMIAGLATLSWALLPPGILRQACFYLATTSWVLSLLLNASPFMRFDGYFILSDLLDMPNLHERAAALARTAIRRGLLGWQEPWPEPFAAPRRRRLIAFAWVTWIYRLAVYLGIAVAVYHFFFKALGIFLFAVEIGFFIVRPCWRELRIWSQRRRETRGTRRFVLLLIPILFLVWLAVPSATPVRAPALARPAQMWAAFAPTPARVDMRIDAGPVAAGDVLVSLDNPELASQADAARAGIRGGAARLSGLLDQSGGLDQQAATIESLALSRANAASVAAEKARLTLRAPFAGVWLDVSPEVRAGTWVGQRQPLGWLVNPDHWIVEAFVSEEDVHALRPGDRGCFYFELSPRRQCGSIEAIAPARLQQLSSPMLATVHDGPIPAFQKQDALIPEYSLYAVRVTLDEPLPVLREQRGKAYFTGAERSRLMAGLRYVASLAIRESGF
ncbi:HlyD family efflux transporter periplasmic adaptor subunit [Achromobacter arsenitoxydans]|uniref:Putative membrane zinc metallopeptidase, M50 family protein n=1 Tax=Achromobacter arsenitoxydans SY8 TaxID=477184 RepID=H0F8C7_9BURK|nr:HlyD family efflux transporter periplasmic adaptor subunit [Achromobacter arsenitoxydans]EHK65560.1 putative membrane zinc metallopeptidase, M50 family protein [Achromobacter arsenitoxydans SY8]